MLCVASGGNPCASLRTVAVDPKVVPYLALWPCPAGSACKREQSDIISLNVSLPGISKRRLRYGTGGPENIRQGQPPPEVTSLTLAR